MSAGIWIISRVTLTADAKKYGWKRVHYPFAVQGVNVATGFEPFSWKVRNLHSESYSLTHAVIDEDARRALLEQECAKAVQS